MLRDIVTSLISTEPDMSVVGVCDDRADLLSATRRSHPNIVMFELLTDDLAPPYLDLMYAEPRTRLLGLRLDGGSARCYEMRPTRRDVADVSGAGLLALIRGLGGSGDAPVQTLADA